MKLSVIYHSKTGNTKAMAQAIVAGMERVEGVQARAFPIEELDEEWVKESCGVLLGSPTYLASVSGEIKMWLDNCAGKLGLAGKLGGAFATANYVHGGGDLAIRLILDHMMVLGMLTYSGGGAFGKPVIHLGPVAVAAHLEEYQETFMLYGERMAKEASVLFG
ncbi:MAG: NAD(P)H-dependent oxidoreductase [Pseudoflavonifractor sp.]|nr:NAD(P)H-dependent oxidoreductase [Pseudoflavonifractor sp.]